MKKVLIPTKLDKFAAKLLTDKGFAVVQDAEKPLADLAAANSDAEVMIVRSEKVTPEIIDAMPSLKLVVRAGAGFNTIDIKYARKRNIDVMNTPGANSNAVAEEVVAMILAAYRFVIAGDNSTRAGGWDKKKFMGSELTGKTIGIMGLGHIGQLLVKRLSGFEVKVLGYDPFLSSELAEQLGVNLNMTAADLASIDQAATGVFNETGRTIKPFFFAERLAFYLVRRYIIYSNEPKALFAEWKLENRLIGRELTVIGFSGARTGIFEDIAPGGEMLLRRNGELEKICSGDVKIEPSCLKTK